MGKSKKGKSNAKNDQQWLWIDPCRIRFQHARIRPTFSGCGRRVEDTLESIRKKELAPEDLPPIQVIVGPEDETGPWYFSLNNRRLWVLKRCREEGLLKDNKVRVRVRQPKSGAEQERYTLANCAVEAKFIREKETKKKIVQDVEEEVTKSDVQTPRNNLEGANVSPNSRRHAAEEASDDDTDSDSDDSFMGATPNPFSALM